MAIFYPDTRVPNNPEILGVLTHAALADRKSGRKNADDLHLAATLIRIGSVACSLSAIGVDLARARARIEGLIAALPKRSWAPLTLQMRMVKVIHQAAESAFGAGLAELDGPYLFATLVSLEQNSELAAALRDVGFTLRAYRWYLAHGEKAAAPVPETGWVEIVFHNDPFTPMQVVVDVLTNEFGKDAASAQELMMRVHREGRAAVAVLDAGEAKDKLARLRARADDAPLRATLTPVAR